MNFDVNKLKWIRKPKDYNIEKDKIVIITEPHTDLWQRTYYHFRKCGGNPRLLNCRDEST